MPTELPAVNLELLRILHCPVCKIKLDVRDDNLDCPKCTKIYPIVLGIPDLRVYEDPLIPLEDDYRKGDKVEAQAKVLGFADLVRYYWSLPTYPYTPPDLRERFIQHVLNDEARIEGYRDRIASGTTFLEVGCGTAALVKVVQSRFQFAVGCDVAFRWLLIARKRLQEAGLPVNLVCCCADYLPFPDGYFDSVASVSLLEHVSNAEAAIKEISRVTSGSGSVFTWTTNRFSIAPEPHVRVWGVGFLPRRWMPAYVKWRSGLAYEKKHLLSRFEIRRYFLRAGLVSATFSLPVITEADRHHLKGIERAGARAFSWFSRISFIRSALVLISPVLLVEARRRPSSSQPNPAAAALSGARK